MMKKCWMIGCLIATCLSVPAVSQPVQQNNTMLSPKALQVQKAKFAWLLGTWRADHMYGSNSNRSGAIITFYMESDGTVSARLDKMSDWMKGSEKRFRRLLGRRFIRGVRTNGRPRSVWSHSAGGGEVFDKNSGNWTNLGIIYTDIKNGKLSHLGAMSDFAHWVKISGSSNSRVSDQPNVPNYSSQEKLRPGMSSTDPGSTGNDAQQPSAPKDNKRLRCIHLPTYATLLNTSTGRAIKNYSEVTATIAQYDPGLPGARLYPSSVQNNGTISAKHIALIRQLEAITSQMVTNRGPDNWLKQQDSRIRSLHGMARDKYDGAAKRAADSFRPCPKYQEPIPFARLAEAEEIITKLRQRRDTVLKPLLAQSDQLSEVLTRDFYEKLADTNSLQDKAKVWIRQKITDALKGERVEPRKIEALIPQLDALQDQYKRLAESGAPISEGQRSRDLADALKRAGIEYDASKNQNIARNTVIKIQAKTFDYIRALIIENYAPDVLKLSSRAAGFAVLAKDTAEIINALKNIYDLWDVRQDAMPNALAVAEARAYLIGLIRRYDRVESEYQKLRKLYKNAVVSSGELSNRKW